MKPISRSSVDESIDKPILITGAARSGTSLTAGIFYLCGAYGGALCGPTPYNPKGQFENTPIVSKLVKPFLKGIGCDPLGQKPLPDPTIIDAIASKAMGMQWRKKIADEIIRQGYKNSRPWFYKGAKLCLIWQLWHAAFPKAHWIVAYRRDELTINSCMRTSFMKKHTTREGWQEWVDHHKRQFDAMEAAGLDVRRVDTERIVNRDFEEIKDAVEHTGLTWKGISVGEFIDPNIWQSQSKRR